MPFSTLGYIAISSCVTLLYAFPYIHIIVFRKSSFQGYREELYTKKILPRLSAQEHVVFRASSTFRDWPALVFFWALTSFTFASLILVKFNAIAILVAIVALSIPAYHYIHYLNSFYSCVVATDTHLYWFTSIRFAHTQRVAFIQVEKIILRYCKNMTSLQLVVDGKKYLGSYVFSRADIQGLFAALGKALPPYSLFQSRVEIR